VAEQSLNPSKAALMLHASQPGLSRQSLPMKGALKADWAMRTGEPAHAGRVMKIETNVKSAD
jgi:DNA-binding transcriptional LysR family regulator